MFVNAAKARIWSGIIVGISLLCLVGCGSGGSPESTAAAPAASISKAAFIKKANAICAKTRNSYFRSSLKLSAEEERTTDKSRRELELELIATKLLPGLQQEIHEIRTLGTPPGDEGKVDRILSTLGKVVDEADEDPKEFLERQVHFKRPFTESERLADAYGITSCGAA